LSAEELFAFCREHLAAPQDAALTVRAVVARVGTGGTLGLVSIIAAAGLVALAGVPLLPVAGLAYMTVMSMSSMHGATRNVFGQQLVEGPWRTTTAAILTVGMGLGWASAAAELGCRGDALVSSLPAVKEGWSCR